MTHRFIPSKKFNRDRREDAFARSIIALAERKRQTLAEEAQEVLDGAECEHCGKLTCLGDCPQYYEVLQDQMETRDDDED